MAFRIGLIAPYPRLQELAVEVCSELGEEIQVLQGDLGEGVRIAQKMQTEGVDVIISRGGTALVIEQSVDVPVVHIQVTGFDILRAVYSATSMGKRIGIMGFRNVIYGAECLNDMLDAHIELIYVDAESDAEHAVADAVARGLEVIVGDAVSKRMTAAHGITGVLIESGKSSIVKAIEDAKHVAAVRRRERQRAEEFKAILDCTSEGIIAVDRDGVLRTINPAAERLLGVAGGDAKGMHIASLIPGMRYEPMRDGKGSKLGSVHRIGRATLVSNRVPITVGDEVLGAVFTFQDASSIEKVEKEVRRQLYLRGHIAKHTFNDIVAVDSVTTEVTQMAECFASTDWTVLLLGETGTGKEMYAQSIHNSSRRAGGPFVAVNCAALPEALLESELFGYEEGAFTGSRKGGKPGLFELAHGGTVFLDEIGDMSLSMQARLLRVLEQREVMRVGSDKVIPVDVRVIAATHRDLGRMVQEGMFRADLLYRINVLTIRIPPLRERPGDIAEMAKRMLAASCRDLGVEPKSFSPQAEDVLRTHTWPGNARELRNLCDRLVVSVDGSIVSRDIVTRLLDDERTDPSRQAERASPGETLISVTLPFEGGLRGIEEYIMRRALEAARGDKSKAASMLGINRSTLWRRLSGAIR